MMVGTFSIYQWYYCYWVVLLYLLISVSYFCIYCWSLYLCYVIRMTSSYLHRLGVVKLVIQIQDERLIPHPSLPCLSLGYEVMMRAWVPGRVIWSRIVIIKRQKLNLQQSWSDKAAENFTIDEPGLCNCKIVQSSISYRHIYISKQFSHYVAFPNFIEEWFSSH